ncbi:hypothetical protein [Vagococcus fluvialis]|uniref:DUF2812 domain-containing protein n=1 Tax=Vagococcus fluvialis TaxID=2738 RepID=A0A7X6D7P3_9ENTE|nr:hypothetical protein [Vagococcus fluvialis]NKC67366.1 hypothetical protein [Vagococcus fluvialis]
MKKLRFYRSGSKKEAYFLQNMLAENYLLKKKIGCFYTFTENDETSKDLIIEFIDAKTFKLDSKLREDFENQTTLNKKTWLAPFYISYSYLESESFESYSNELSDESELNFLKCRSYQLSYCQVSLVFLGIIIWLLIEIFFNIQLRSAIPIIMFTIVLLWFLLFIPDHFISKQIEELETKLGEFSTLITPTLTIAFKNMTEKPDINKLNFLGTWIFVTERKKKQEFYFKLKTNFSREDLITDISSILNIDKESISITAPGDLFGLNFL